MNDHIITTIASDVREILAGAEGGHDWWHIYRVWQNAKQIAMHEDMINHEVIELAALLHDIADPKFHDGDEEVGPATARAIMSNRDVDEDIIDHVVLIIRHMSFKNSLGSASWESPELYVVRDADRLDAIGAVGIARAFNYGGFKNRSMFDPDIRPQLNMTKEEYKKNQGPTINHFYEKLLKLKGLMHTESGKALANKRHQFMMDFLDHFYMEIGHIPDWHAEISSSE